MEVQIIPSQNKQSYAKISAKNIIWSGKGHKNDNKKTKQKEK